VIRFAAVGKTEKDVSEAGPGRAPSVRITAEESLRRTREFAAARREKFVAAIRKSQG
jgi:hypothetical protein